MSKEEAATEGSQSRSDSTTTPNDTNFHGGDECGSSLLIFDPDRIRTLAQSPLPPQYVGVRRIRPSTKHVARQLVAAKQKNRPSSSTTTAHLKSDHVSFYTTVTLENGITVKRRMTSQEKKQAKFEQKQRIKLLRKQQKHQQSQQQQHDNQSYASKLTSAAARAVLQPPSVEELQLQPEKQQSNIISASKSSPRKNPGHCPSTNDPDDPKVVVDTNSNANDDDGDPDDPSNNLVVSSEQYDDSEGGDNNNTNTANTFHSHGHRYVQWAVDPIQLALELADLQGGERWGTVPPVLWSAPIVAAVKTTSTTVELDDTISQVWAQSLKESMHDAEWARHQEVGIRPMPYHLVPRVWTRLRPNKSTDALWSRDLLVFPGWNSCSQPPPTHENNNDSKNSTAFLECTVRKPHKEYDAVATATIVALCNMGITMSCGVKFGCDFLCYDGPRHARHAFAGLRVIAPSDALPTAYDLAGYTRTLNTAGKIALLATIVSGRLAIVDLALEQTAFSVITKRRANKTLEHRYQKLAKTTKIINL
jgi:hypothetical protein